jgi:DNA-binding CsgD family transcriptional regulator
MGLTEDRGSMDTQSRLYMRPRILSYFDEARAGDTIFCRVTDGSDAHAQCALWVAEREHTTEWLARAPQRAVGSPDVVVLSLIGGVPDEGDAIIASRDAYPESILIVLSTHAWPRRAIDAGFQPDVRVSTREFAFTDSEISLIGERLGVATTAAQRAHMLGQSAGIAGMVLAALEAAQRSGTLGEDEVQAGCFATFRPLLSARVDFPYRRPAWEAGVAMAHLGALSTAALDAVWDRGDYAVSYRYTLADAGAIIESSPGVHSYVPGIQKAMASLTNVIDDADNRSIVSDAVARLASHGRFEDAVRVGALSPFVRARLLARHWREALTLPASVAREALRGASRQLSDPRLMLALVRALIDPLQRDFDNRISSSQLQEAQSLLARIEQTAGLEPEDAAIVVTMRATVDRVEGRPEVGLARLRALESVHPARADRAAVHFHVGLMHLELGDATAALESFDSARSEAHASGDGNLAALAEELSLVAAHVQLSSHFSTWSRTSRTILTGSSLPLAAALDPVDGPELRRLLATPADYSASGMTALSVLEATLRARAYSVLGLGHSALGELELLESGLLRGLPTPSLRRWVLLSRAEALLVLRRPDEVLELLDETAFSPLGTPHAALHRAHALVLLGRGEEAAELLGDLLPQVRSRSVRFTIRAQVTLHRARLAFGDEAGADAALVDALHKTAQTGLLLPFFRHGRAWVVRILDAAVPFTRDPAVAKLVRSMRETLRELGGAREAVSLTPRERDVLSLMAGTDTIAQIADALGVTQNTIKSQLRGLYRKLGAVSRDEAVLAARTAGLLS